MTLNSRDGFPARLLVAALIVCSSTIVFTAASSRPSNSQTNSTVASPASAAAQTGGYAGDDTCTTCHDSEGKALKQTLHGKAQNVRTPSAQNGRTCETCHGPGQAHAESGGDTTKIRRIPALAPREASAVCLTCHDRGNHANFKGGMHDARNLTCVTCHSIHSPKSDKGKMTCVSCHNPHGTTNVRMLRVGNWINETCVSCHAEKRGPFLWDHAPVREACNTCHDPHGSNNQRMLVSKLPMLCQRCHIGTRHPSTIYDGNQLKARSNRLIGRGCVNCHAQIHGSNSPAGNAFLR